MFNSSIENGEMKNCQSNTSRNSSWTVFLLVFLSLAISSVFHVTPSSALTVLDERSDNDLQASDLSRAYSPLKTTGDLVRNTVDSESFSHLDKCKVAQPVNVMRE